MIALVVACLFACIGFGLLCERNVREIAAERDAIDRELSAARAAIARLVVDRPNATLMPLEMLRVIDAHRPAGASLGDVVQALSQQLKDYP